MNVSQIMILNSIFNMEIIKKVPKLKNDTNKTLIQTVSKSSSTPTNSFIIISSKGTVLVADPTSMPAPEELELNPDIVTATHTHTDHMDPKFMDNIDCKKSIGRLDRYSIRDVDVYGVASSHKGNLVDKQFPDNVIYVFELDGIRIAHMGDIGQEHLTIKQIEELGKIDIAFMQFSNPFSGMFNSEKGFTLIEELKPQIIIPTHTNPKSTRKMGKIVGKLEILENELIISREDLDNSRRKVIWLKNTLSY
jgi:L-ascorbate metabolism protein UlaG (beta-lactamase superfamily)